MFCFKNHELNGSSKKKTSINGAEEISMNFLYFSFTDFHYFSAKKDNDDNKISPTFKLDINSAAYIK